MRIVVVTGGIGAGKSVVSDFLVKNGAAGFYSADERTKMLYKSRPELLERIEASLNVRLTDSQGCFAPQLLASVIFSDSSALQQVEDILFPALEQDFQQWMASLGAGEGEGKGDGEGKGNEFSYVVFESATVLEKHYFDNFGDFIIFVDAPFDIRLRRAMARDKVSEQKVLDRMKKQSLPELISGKTLEQIRILYPELGNRINHIVLNAGAQDELYDGLRLLIKDMETMMGNVSQDCHSPENQ